MREILREGRTDASDLAKCHKEFKIYTNILKRRIVMVKIKLSLVRPIGVQKVEARIISRQSEPGGGKVVSPRHRSLLPPRKDSWYSFLLEADAISGP